MGSDCYFSELRGWCSLSVSVGWRLTRVVMVMAVVVVLVVIEQGCEQEGLWL